MIIMIREKRGGVGGSVFGLLLVCASTPPPAVHTPPIAININIIIIIINMIVIIITIVVIIIFKDGLLAPAESLDPGNIYHTYLCTLPRLCILSLPIAYLYTF